MPAVHRRPSESSIIPRLPGVPRRCHWIASTTPSRSWPTRHTVTLLPRPHATTAHARCADVRPDRTQTSIFHHLDAVHPRRTSPKRTIRPPMSEAYTRTWASQPPWYTSLPSCSGAAWPPKMLPPSRASHSNRVDQNCNTRDSILDLRGHARPIEATTGGSGTSHGADVTGYQQAGTTLPFLCRAEQHQPIAKYTRIPIRQQVSV